MQVSVRDNNVEQALRALKKKLQREGVFREMKLKQHFEKPSEKKAREKADAIRRAGSAEPAKIKAALVTTDLVAASGRTRMDAQRNAPKAAGLEWVAAVAPTPAVRRQTR